MREEYKTLKFTLFAYLSKDNATEYDASARVYPQTTRLSTVDKSSLVLTFNHNKLALATCYTLKFDEQLLGVKMDHTSLSSMNRICTTAC